MTTGVWDGIPKEKLRLLAANITAHNEMMRQLWLREELRRALLPSTPPMLDWLDEDDEDDC